jgi:hypothetical protein
MRMNSTNPYVRDSPLLQAPRLAGEVDVLNRMHGPVFDQARAPEGFGEVKMDPETGTVVWPAVWTWHRTRCTNTSVPAHGPTRTSLRSGSRGLASTATERLTTVARGIGRY